MNKIHLKFADNYSCKESKSPDHSRMVYAEYKITCISCLRGLVGEAEIELEEAKEEIKRLRKLILSRKKRVNDAKKGLEE